MAITLDGSNGITLPDNIVHEGDTNTAIRFPAADTVTIETAGSERVRVDSSGNLLVGTTSSPSSSLVKQTLAGNGVYSQWTRTVTTIAGAYAGTDGNGLIFGTHTGAVGSETYAERARIDSSGNLLVGTTSTGGTGTTIYRVASGNAGAPGAIHFNGSSTATETCMSFQHNGIAVGSITRSTTATAYNTSSDYRLKENVAPMQNALDTVVQLNPVTYTWKADGSAGQGFIAHELQAVVPDCVTGEKDAVDTEGKPVYQGIDTSFLVGILTKAIQEQQEQINQLKAEVAALKGN